MKETGTEDMEFELLIEAVYKCYGHDFRNYSPASFKRRVKHFMAKNKIENISELIPLIIKDKSIFKALFYEISITVTSMFRGPFVYKEIREKVIPLLRTYPYIKIWNAGCATGEESYSMAILLKEEGLYERSQIYATDYNDEALETARKGIYPDERIKKYTANYQKSGCKGSFSEYYHSKYGYTKINGDIKENIIFADHNLVTDAVFGEMHLIMCQNVMIYFNRALQDRVLKMFNDSLILNGFLCIGTKESLQFSSVSDDFKKIGNRANIYQKKLR